MARGPRTHPSARTNIPSGFGRREGMLPPEVVAKIRRFHAYQVASSFAIWIPFWALWIRGNLASDFEFTLVDVAFWIGLLVFQLPVGVIADRYGRKPTIVLSEVFRSAGILVAPTSLEPAVERTTEPTYTEQLRQGLRVVRRREGVALLIGLEVFLGVTLYVMAIYRPLYLRFLGLSDAQIAVSIAGFLVVAAIWSAFAGGISRVLGEFGTIALMVAMASAAFFGMYGAGLFPGAVLFQVPIYVVWSLQPALTTAYLNRRLEPGQRATVLSMGAFAYTLALVVLEPVAGLLTTSTGLLSLGLFLGVVTFVPCAYILARWRLTVAPWPAMTPVPSRLVGSGRVSRFHRLLERMSRLRP